MLSEIVPKTHSPWRVPWHSRHRAPAGEDAGSSTLSPSHACVCLQTQLLQGWGSQGSLNGGVSCQPVPSEWGKLPQQLGKPQCALPPKSPRLLPACRDLRSFCAISQDQTPRARAPLWVSAPPQPLIPPPQVPVLLPSSSQVLGEALPLLPDALKTRTKPPCRWGATPSPSAPTK